MPAAPFRAVLIDDDADLRHILTVALERTSRFTVVDTAGTAAAGLAAAERQQPDVILLDLAMPGTGGLEVLAELRRAAPGTRVVVVTGFPGDRLGTAVQERGAVGFVEKGLSPRRMVEEIIAVAGVLDAVEEVLASRRRVLEPELQSGSAARRFMEETLGHWRCGDLLDVVNLLVSELVTNAIVHAGSEADVSVVLTPTALRVEVADREERLPVPRDAEDWATSGRGMALVDALARSWGVEPRAGGKVIWFELDRPDV